MRKALAVLCLLGLLAACGESPARPDIELTVDARDFLFQPNVIEVTVGQRVRLTIRNSGTVEHDFSVIGLTVLPGGSQPASDHTGHTGEVSPVHASMGSGKNAVLEFTPAQAGTYRIECSVAGHKEAGMVGTLIVRAQALTGQAIASPAAPTLAPPSATPVPLTPTSRPLASATALPQVSPTPRAPQPTPVLPAGETLRWEQTLSGLTARMFIDPFPLRMGGQTKIWVVLNDESGQAVPDAAVDVSVNGGMIGMEGEHDEGFNFDLAAEGGGTYTMIGTIGRPDLTALGMTLSVKHGTQTWQFVVPKEDVTP